MTISDTLFTAILAMDTSNRGSNSNWKDKLPTA